jgi:hypothetical protein
MTYLLCEPFVSYKSFSNKYCKSNATGLLLEKLQIFVLSKQASKQMLPNFVFANLLTLSYGHITSYNWYNTMYKYIAFTILRSYRMCWDWELSEKVSE